MLWTVFGSAESTEALRHPCSRRVHFKITIIVFAADVAARSDKVASLYTLTRICSVEYIKRVESVFEIIAEPNRRAILSLLVSSQQSVGEIERQLRMPQPTVSKEKRNENQSDQRIRGRPGQSPALLYGGTGLCQEGRFQPRPISLADRGLARGTERHRVATGAEQQPRGQSVPAGDVSTGPARGDVLHRRRQGRLRADQGARGGVHDAAHRRDRLDHCDAEGHLRQPHSAHAAGTLFTLRRRR